MTLQLLPPFAGYVGAKRPRVLFLGEAWGAEEDQLRSPFIGNAGRFLFQLLGEVIPEAPEGYALALSGLYGIAFRKRRDSWAEAAGVAFTNVLALRPKDNNLENVSVLKQDLPSDYPLKTAPITRNGANRFLAPEYIPELERLRIEIEETKPNLVVALGNTALWALTGTLAISDKRGVVDRANVIGCAPGVKFLPTYHPQACCYNFSLRAIAKADLIKAWRESRTREIVRPEREVIINPTLEDISEWLRQLRTSSSSILSCDIETKAGQLTCIGFASSRASALVVPFWSLDLTSPHYWPSASAEVEAWSLTKEILETPIPKLFQNGMYDLQYLYRLGLRPKAVLHDTMLMHHSMFPELRKGLGFLASIYSNEASWKLMRHEKADVEKADD